MQNLSYQQQLIKLKYYGIIYPIIFFFFFCFNSCTNPNQDLIKISDKDSIVLDIFNNGELFYSIAKNNNRDSSIIIFDSENKKIYFYDFYKKKFDSLKIPNKIISFAKRVTLENENLYILNEDNQTIIHYNLKDERIQNYNLSKNQNSNFYNIFTPFSFENNTTILYQIPDYNFQNKNERKKYFQSKLVSKISILNGNIYDEKQEILFPLKYQDNFYYDYYPIADYDKKTETWIYTFKHTDSIFIKNKELTILPIPLEYSVQSPIFQDSLLSNYNYANMYETIQPLNYKLLINENKILIFQKDKNTFLNEKEEINIFEETPKTIIVCDRLQQKIIKAYRIPDKYESRKSFIFDSYLITPNNNYSQKLILYVSSL